MTVRSYHLRSQNRIGRSAPAPAAPDRSIAPVPFRRFLGADLIPLGEAPPWTPGDAPKTAGWCLDSISRLFQDSLAVSLWREEGGARVSFRVNPSAGNLHPTEAYLLLGPAPGLRDRATLYHYSPFDHALEVRGELGESLPPGVALIGLTTILWRTAWKYGERAFRLAHLDAGHALAALSYAAAVQGWRSRIVEISDGDLSHLLGIESQSGPEGERPVALVAIGPYPALFRGDHPGRTSGTHGRPNRISPRHHDLPGLDEIDSLTRRGALPPPGPSARRDPAGFPGECPAEVFPEALLRGRRSAPSFRGEISSGALFRLLLRTFHAAGGPLRAFPGRRAVSAGLLVQRVRGLEAGAYLLPHTFAPEAPAPGGAPVLEAPLPLRRLGTAPFDSASLAGGQRFAAEAAFIVIFLGSLKAAAGEKKSWVYRRLHWEAGALGHALSLAAAAAGLGARGIGGFFDDLALRALGLPAEGDLQALYLLAVGGLP